VGADRVDTEFRHEAEVFGDLRQRGKLITVGVRCKGPVSVALDEKAILAGSQKFPVRGNRRGCQARGVATDLGVVLNSNIHGSARPTSEQPKWGKHPL